MVTDTSTTMNSPSTHDISRLVVEHGPFMERLALALTGGAAEAEDLLHDTWIEALKHGVQSMRNERGWLVMAMRRRAGALRRKRRPVTGALDALTPHLEGPKESLPAVVVERMEVERLIGAALGRLGEPYRTTIYLRYREGWTPKKIAASIDTPVATVKTRLRRGLDQLRVELDGLAETSGGHRPRDLWMSLLLPVAGSPHPLHAAALPLLPATGWLTSLLMKKTLLGALVLLLAASTFWVLQGGLSIGSADVESVEARGDSASVGATSAGDSRTSDAILDNASPGAPLERALLQGGTEVATSLVVTVLDADREPIASGSVIAVLEATNSGPSSHSVAQISPSGAARFLDPIPGSYLIQDTTSTARKRVSVDPATENAVTLVQENDPLSRVHGMVVDPEGNPVSGATIWARRLGPYLPAATTRADGAFELHLSEDSSLQASVPARLPSGAVSLHNLDGDARTGRTCTFTLGAAAAKLAGRVVSADGRPVAGAFVTAGSLDRVSFQENMFRTPEPVTVIADSNGRFEYGHALPEGTWRVGALAPDGRGLVRSIAVGSADLEVLLTVQPGATIEGVVSGVDGNPAVGAQVSLRPIRSDVYRDDTRGILGYEHYTATGSDGAFRLTGVLGLDVDLEAQSAYAEPLAKDRVELAPLLPGETRRIDLELSDGPVLAGLVVDEAGLPLPNLAIRAKQKYGASYRQFVKTDAAGKFRLTSVPQRPGGKDSWKIDAETYGSAHAEVLGSVSGVALGTEDIVIVAKMPISADAYVTGRVVFTGDELPANVDVTLSRIYDPEPRVRSGSFIDVDRKTGSFKFGPVSAGKYRIQARQTDELIGTVEGIVVGSGETVIAPDLTID